METRQVTETKIYLLVLNDMRSNTEQKSPYAWSFDKQKLIDWYERQKILGDSLKDEGAPSFECHGSSHTWHKTFNIGGSLEWCNPYNEFRPDDNSFEPNSYGHGIHEEWIKDISTIRTDLQEVS